MNTYTVVTYRAAYGSEASSDGYAYNTICGVVAIDARNALEIAAHEFTGPEFYSNALKVMRDAGRGGEVGEGEHWIWQAHSQFDPRTGRTGAYAWIDGRNFPIQHPRGYQEPLTA